MLDHVGTILDVLDITQVEVELGVGKPLQKFCIGMVAFRPEVNHLSKLWVVWKLVYKAKQKGPINRHVIKHMTASYVVEHPLTCNMADSKAQHWESRWIYL